MIGSSDGNQYETDYDVAIERPVGAPTEPAGALKTSGGTLPTPVDQKAIDELVAAAPNFANNPVIDQMSATAERSRPELPISGVAEADPIANKKGSKLTPEQLRQHGLNRLNLDVDPIQERQRDPFAEDLRRSGGYYSIPDAEFQMKNEAIRKPDAKDNMPSLPVKINQTPVKMPGDLTEEQRNEIFRDDYWKQLNLLRKQHLKNKS